MDDGPLVLSNRGVLKNPRHKCREFFTVKNLKKRHIIVAAISITFVIAIYYLLTDQERAIKKGVVTYIEAMADRDFDTLCRYHAPTQKRIVIAMKSPRDLEVRLKVIYDEQKRAFEGVSLVTDFGPIWSEKFLLIKGMRYKITDIRMVEDRENPSLPIRERMNAFVEVEVEYTDRETAPDLGGRVKNVTYIIKLVHSRDVARTWIGEPQEKRWLFSGIAVKEGSLVYYTKAGDR